MTQRPRSSIEARAAAEPLHVMLDEILRHQPDQGARGGSGPAGRFDPGLDQRAGGDRADRDRDHVLCASPDQVGPEADAIGASSVALGAGALVKVTASSWCGSRLDQAGQPFPAGGRAQR